MSICNTHLSSKQTLTVLNNHDNGGVICTITARINRVPDNP